MYFVSLWLTLVGIYLYVRGKADFIKTPLDYYGFGFIKHLNQEGTEFPLPFVMKRINHTSLVCRHLIASGMLHILLASLMYGPITYGRLLVVSLYTMFIILGVSNDEWYSMKEGGLQYR